MSRIYRIKWTMCDFGNLNTSGLFGVFDSAIKTNLRITDEELDKISELASDDELNIIINENPDFKTKREIINILKKYIDYNE